MPAVPVASYIRSSPEYVFRGNKTCAEKPCEHYPELGCVPTSQGFLCSCTHTRDVPYTNDTGYYCVRKVVATNHTSHGHSIDIDHVASKRDGYSHEPTPMALTILGICLATMLASAIVCFLKRKTLKRMIQGDQQSKFEMDMRSVLSGQLLPERFMKNPLYESAVLDLAIRIFTPDEVLMKNQIGQGCFGKVFKGDLNGMPVAVKVVKSEHAGEAMKEVETMVAFNHPNILHMIGIAKNMDMEAPWLLFEFMEYGDLASVLRSVANPGVAATIDDPEKAHFHATRETLMDFACQISEGMKYLSSQHFVHRDLAARNCLVGIGGHVKISDFGLSRDVYTCDYYKIGGSRLLPVRWMSPESVLYGRFTLESDVWAYGVLLWEIYTWGTQPYYGHSNEEVVQLILDGVLLCPPSDCPPLIRQLMAGCWKTETKDRLQFPHICEKFATNCKASTSSNCSQENSLDKSEEDDEEAYEIPNKPPKPYFLEYTEVI